MSIHRLPFLDHALLYERHGLRVLPVARLTRVDGALQCACWRGAECSDPGKHPLQTGWRDRPTNIGRWWALGGAWNVGIQAGAASGIVVIDVDPRHAGNETLAALEQQHGSLPPTWQFLTGGGGTHIVFRHPGGHVANGANVLGSGIDVRGDGGFIVAPPSLHISGRRYAISVDHHPDELPLAPLPDWLHERLIERRKRELRQEKPVRPCRGLSRYGEVALDNACRRILGASNGQQEETLNREAYSIGRLAGAGALPADFTLRVLKYVVQRVISYDEARPWREVELATKVERAFSDGMHNPRRARA
jgi:bifunctional DNA primase/polymerase-like protein